MQRKYFNEEKVSDGSTIPAIRIGQNIRQLLLLFPLYLHGTLSTKALS